MLITNPKVALELNALLPYSQVLSFQQNLLHHGSESLDAKVQLFECFIYGHPPNKASLVHMFLKFPRTFVLAWQIY